MQNQSIDLKSFVTIKDKGAAPYAPPPIRCAWGDDGGAPFFWIKCPNEELGDKARKESIDPDEPSRTVKERGFRVKTVDNVNDEIMTQRLVFHLIDRYEGLTIGGLKTLLDPSKASVNGPNDVAIPVSDANKEVIALASTHAFKMWVVNNAGETRAFHEAKREDEAKNSQSTPAGL